MNAVNLVFDVHASVPNWITKDQPMIHFEKDFANSRYRIYVNDDLIVERTWTFDNDKFLRESLWLNYNPDDYNVRLETVVHNPIQIKFSLHNPTVNNKYIDHNIDQLELSFKL